MENNLSELVYDALKTSTEKMEDQKNAVADLEERANSGRYSTAAIKDFNEQIANLRRDIRKAADAAIIEARHIVDEFEAAARREMCLKPEDLTDEVKLFNAGVTLTEDDLQAMLDRVGDNTTMRILIHRYAKDHGIDLPQYGFPEFTAKLDAAKNVRGVIGYFDRWISENNARTMLDKFFNVRA